MPLAPELPIPNQCLPLRCTVIALPVEGDDVAILEYEVDGGMMKMPFPMECAPVGLQVNDHVWLKASAF